MSQAFRNNQKLFLLLLFLVIFPLPIKADIDIRKLSPLVRSLIPKEFLRKIYEQIQDNKAKHVRTSSFDRAFEKFYDLDNFKLYPNIFLESEFMPPTTAQEHVVKALSLFLSINFQKKVEIYNFQPIINLLDIEVSDSSTAAFFHYFRGSVQMRIGDIFLIYKRDKKNADIRYELADKEFEEAIKLNPSYLEAYKSKIYNAVRNLREIESALRLVEESICLFPAEPELFFCKSEIYYLLLQPIKGRMYKTLGLTFLTWRKQALKAYKIHSKIISGF